MHKLPHTRTNRHAFTLIELLTVISIVTVLAGLLLPALGRAKQSARITACLNNLHQIGLAMEMYVSENNHRLPYCAQIPSLQTNLPPIMAVLYPQLGASNIWECRSDTKYYAKEKTSYEWNIYLNGASYNTPEADWSATTRAVVETIFGGRLNTPLMGDASPCHGQSGSYSGKNALYFDGRVDRGRIKASLPVSSQ